MKKMQKRYRTELDISTLWDEFRNDKLFDFDEISSIKKVNSDTFEFSFKCRRNKFFGFSYPEFKGTVKSNKEKVSYITMSSIRIFSRPTIFLYFIVSYILGLLFVRHNIYYIIIPMLLFMGVIYIQRNPYFNFLQEDLYYLEDRYKLEMIPNQYIYRSELKKLELE